MGMSSQELFEHMKRGEVTASDVLLAMAKEAVASDDLECVPLICAAEAAIMSLCPGKVPFRIGSVLLNNGNALGALDDVEGFEVWRKENPRWASDLEWAATRSDFPEVVYGMKVAIQTFSEERRGQRDARVNY